MIKKILNATEPALREKSKPVKKVDKKIKSLISDLKETLRSQDDPEGVGLAAPQIGKNVRLFVMLYGKDIKTIINPKVLSSSKEKKTEVKKDSPMEGCLSVPHYYGPLSRPQNIKINYLNDAGEKVEEEFSGFDAQIIQHEIDHLNGILFIDRLLKKKLPLYEYKDDEWVKVD